MSRLHLMARSLLGLGLCSMFGLALSGALAGCGSGGGSGGGGGASASAAATAVAAPNGPVRLVGLRREMLNPSSAPALWLFSQVPSAVPASQLVLEESVDGVSFQPIAGRPNEAVAGAALFELPVPQTTRFYRVAAPIGSNTVTVQPQTGVGALRVSDPVGGAVVNRTPTVTTSGTGSSFLYAISDPAGGIVWLSEGGPTVQVGGPVVANYVSAATLAGDAGHVLTVVSLDANAYARAVSPRVDFKTTP